MHTAVKGVEVQAVVEVQAQAPHRLGLAGAPLGLKRAPEVLGFRTHGGLKDRVCRIAHVLPPCPASLLCRQTLAVRPTSLQTVVDQGPFQPTSLQTVVD